MKRIDFINKCVDSGYQWSEGTKGVYLKKGDNKLHVLHEVIEEKEWDYLQRGIPDVTHMSRIVGYYSSIENWNKSKLGELEGRHRGNYATKEST